jgi:hypothetical protein
MWYPVRLRISTRQESQFKYTRPDVKQPWSGRAFIKEGNCRFDFNRPDDCLSWSRRAHISYGNYVLKISRSGRSSPMVRTLEALYGKYLQRTCNRLDDCVFRLDAALKQERFSAKFSKIPVAQLPVRTAMTTVRTAPAYISAVAHSTP